MLSNDIEGADTVCGFVDHKFAEAPWVAVWMQVPGFWSTFRRLRVGMHAERRSIEDEMATGLT